MNSYVGAMKSPRFAPGNPHDFNTLPEQRGDDWWPLRSDRLPDTSRALIGAPAEDLTSAHSLPQPC
jgi:hypothetical protein